MNEQEYIERLKTENKILQDKLDRLEKGKKRKRRFFGWLFKKASTPIIGSKLKRSISNAINEYKEYKTVSVDTVSDVSSNVVWRLTRIGLFAFFFAILPSSIMIIQTWLVVNQNDLVNNQNILVESQRKSSLVFVMDNVLSDLSNELKSSTSRNVGKPLEARIISLAMAMQPYEYEDAYTGKKKKGSPERGQLLFNLLMSDLGDRSTTDILNAADFTYSDVKKMLLGTGANLRYARLDYSDFSQAYMPQANLQSAELKYANLEGVNLSESNLKRTSFINANLENAELLSSDLTNANLRGANLTKTDLSEAILWGVKLEGADLSDIILDNAIVNREDWIAYVKDSLDLKGSGSIEKNYRIKMQGKQQFTLVRR